MLCYNWIISSSYFNVANICLSVTVFQSNTQTLRECEGKKIAPGYLFFTYSPSPTC